MAPRPLPILLVGAVLIVAVLAVPTGAAVAQSGSSPVDEILDGVQEQADANASSGLERARQAVDSAFAFANGVVNRALSIGDPEMDAGTACGDLKAEFNSHSAAIQSYVNNRSNASTDADVLKVECSIEDSSATVFLTATVNGSDYENASMVSSTSRTADESCTLDSDAAARVDDELDHMVQTYIKPGTDVPQHEIDRLAARYGGMVSCSFMG